MAFSPNAETVYADGPFGSPLQPSKPEIRSLLAQYEAAIDAYSSGAGSIAKSTRALLFADLAHAADVTAWVYADSTVAYNGIYRKSGASGAGSWSLILPLPFSFIIASDAGGGTPNSIQATTSIPVSGSALIWMNVFEANTASPVTVSFNGGATLTIKTNSGNNVAVGGLTAGMIVLGIVSGSTFRLVSDQSSAAIVAAAEAAAAAAEAAKVAAEAAAASLTYASQAEAEAGTANNRIMSPLRTKQQIDSRVASNADADAGTDGAKIITPEKVVRWFDNWATKLWGTSSLGRTQRARWSDTVNLRDWFDRTGADGSAAVNDTALAALITYLNANPQVRTLKGNKGDVYRVSAVNQTFPAGIRLMMDDAKFRWSGNNGGNNSQFLQFELGSRIEGFALDIVSGSTFRRLLGTTNGCRIIDWEILAESQVNNYGGSLLDWAIRIYRSDNKVRGLKVTNIDKAVFAYGADGDGNPGLDNKFIDVEVYNYVTGFCIRNQLGASNRGYRCKGRSVNATDDPGNNGLLHEGVAEYLLDDFMVKDSGEHGVRFGGTRSAEQASRIITVGNGSIWRAGQSGFKMFAGIAGQKFLHVNVSNVNVIDCQYEPETPAEAPGFNDEGFLLQNIQHGMVQGCKVSKQDSITGFSCMDGMYISGADNLVVDGFYCDSPKRNALRISEHDGDTAGNSVEILANNEIMVRAMQGENVGEHGIYLNHPTQPVRDINIEAEVIGTNAATFYGLSGDAAIGRFSQPCTFQLKSRGFAAGLHNLPAGAAVKVRDIHGSTY
ncbi:hypothetical protein [Sinorhizobium meliloti]|uniref:hypothetical protein n=1 Tax=Rhizobium meliloti TaxID=382 RepID=UPI000FD37C21|nr:hypothetical protein [Sinorhizobium meliloti]RVJ89840.1 hypothetical protein CN173_24535 [Sinorhizobium meliloti]